MSDNETQVEDVQNVSAALRAGMAMGKPRHHAGHVPYTIVPEGGVLHELTAEAERPARIKAHPKFDEAASLVAYLNSFKDEGTQAFADVASGVVSSVLDYHQAKDPASDQADGHAARYCDHRATFTAKASPEWQTWLSKNGVAMNQEQFAVFIEDNAPDVKHPDAVDLYETCLALQATSTGEFKSVKRLQDGSVNFSFSEETSATAGGSTIPKAISVLLRPYLGCTAVVMEARFRYRIKEGRLSLWYDLLRHEQVKRDAFEAIVAHIEEGTDLTVLRGTPPA